MKNIKYLTLLLLLWTRSLIGQETTSTLPDIHNLLPPSPEMASLGKYGEIPVGHHTGIPSISIPIGVVNGRELSTSVSLNYHASGIKVESKAEAAGQGWTLSGGGQISRTVRGLPDEMNTGGRKGYLHSSNLLPSDIGEYNDWYNDCNNYVLMQQLSNNFTDGQPDFFNFSAPGLSGKFFFGADGKVHLVPAQPVKIEYTSGFGKFTITSPQGVKYTFSAVSHTTTTSDMGDMLDYTNYKTTWHLTRMESARGGDFIEFSYDFYKTRTILTSESKSDCFSNDPLCQSSTNQLVNQSYTYLDFNDSRRLKEIKSLKNRIEFKYASRLDNINGEEDQKLSSIELYDTPTAILPSRTFNLKHTYFGTSSNYRLKLDEIEQLAGSESMPSYYFTYSDFNVSRTSKAQDWWGFYNGKDANNQLIPAMSNMPPLVLEGADRSSDLASSIKGMITSITYPTGGKTEFEFEAHDYHHIPSKYPITEPYSYSNLDFQLFEAEAECSSNICPALKVESTTFSPYVTGIYDVDYVISWKGNCSNNLIGMDNIPAYVKIIKQSNGEVVLFKQTNATDYQPGNEGRVLVSGNESFNFEIGETYVIEAGSPYKCIRANITANIPTGGENFQTNPENGLEVWAAAVGGPRIKSITNYDKNNAFVGKKVYKYRKAKEDFISSGELISIPRHGYFQSQNVTNNQGLPAEIAYFTRSSSSTGHMSSISGSHVVYSEVIEMEVDRNEVPNGETVYKYNIAKKQSAHYFPFPPVENRDWQDGFLSYVGYFKHENGERIPVKETNYFYQQVGELYQSPSLVFRAKKDASIYTCNPQIQLQNIFGDAFFYTISGNKSQLIETERLYAPDGQSSTVVSTKYNEFNPNTLLPIKSEVSGKVEGEKIITQQSYVSDFDLCGNNYAICYTDKMQRLSEIKDTYYNALTQAQLNYESEIQAYYQCVENRDAFIDTYCTPLGTYDIGCAMEANQLYDCKGNFYDPAMDNYNGAVNAAYEIYQAAKKQCYLDFDCDALCVEIVTIEYAVSDAEVKAIADMNAANVLLPALEEVTIIESPDGSKKLAKAIYQKMNGNHLKPVEIFTADSKTLVNDFPFALIEKIGGTNQIVKSSDYQSEGTLAYDNTTSSITGSTQLNDIKMAIFWDGDKLHPIAKAVNAAPNQIWHTSFEDYEENLFGSWTGNIAVKDPVLSIEGLAYGDYKLTYWQYNTQLLKWELQERDIVINSSNHSESLSGIVDEVRVFPKGAQMSTVSYDEAGRVLTECDVNGHVIRYEYDAFGRLLVVRDEDGNILKAYKYQFGN